MSVFTKSTSALAGALLVASAGLAAADGTVTPGQVKIGTDLTYPPYNYFDSSGEPAGFDVEFMNLLAGKTGDDVVFLDTRFENLIIGVNGDQFDVIASTLYVKPERAEKVDYVPYMKTGVSIAVTSGADNPPTTPEELCGQTVGSIKGAAWLEEFEKLNETVCGDNPIDSREFPTSPEATQALLSGAVDAQVEDSAVLANASDKLGGRLMIASEEQFYPVIVGLGVKKGNDALVETLRSAIAELDADGSYDALLEKYNVDKPTEEEFQAAVGN